MTTKMMRILKPSSRYATKLYTIASIVAMGVLLLGILIAGYLSFVLKEAALANVVLKSIIVVDVCWYLPALGLTRIYYRALRYELNEKEIVIRTGVWNKSTRRIPLDAVTEMFYRWDALDRWLEIGTLTIRTASNNGTHDAEENLAGLSDVNGTYQLLHREVQRFQDVRAPLPASVEEARELA